MTETCVAPVLSAEDLTRLEPDYCERTVCRETGQRSVLTSFVLEHGDARGGWLDVAIATTGRTLKAPGIGPLVPSVTPAVFVDGVPGKPGTGVLVTPAKRHEGRLREARARADRPVEALPPVDRAPYLDANAAEKRERLAACPSSPARPPEGIAAPPKAAPIESAPGVPVLLAVSHGRELRLRGQRKVMRQARALRSLRSPAVAVALEALTQAERDVFLAERRQAEEHDPLHAPWAVVTRNMADAARDRLAKAREAYWLAATGLSL